MKEDTAELSFNVEIFNPKKTIRDFKFALDHITRNPEVVGKDIKDELTSIMLHLEKMKREEII